MPLTTNTSLPAVKVETKNERDIVRIATFSTALALGTVFASNQALTRDVNGFVWHLSAQTLLAFVVGAAIGYSYWKIIDRSSDRQASGLLRVASFVLLLVGIGAFLYPLRFLPTDQLPDVAKGLAVDVVALSALGWILWQIRNFLNADTEQAELAERKAAANPPLK
jgi:uncharacterized membrane protein